MLNNDGLLGCFISIPNCRCETIIEIFKLGECRDNHYAGSYNQYIIYENHQRLKVLEENFNLENKYVFTFVRNPYDRIKSWYYCHKDIYPYNSKSLNEWIKDGCQTHWKIQNKTNWEEEKLSPLLQYNFIDGNKNLDYIGKIENFDEDCKNIISDINNILEKNNNKNRLTYKFIKKNISIKNNNEEITDENKELIYNMFKKDFDYFNYGKRIDVIKYKLKNIPNILWINLDKSQDRYNYMLKQFNDYNITNHNRIPAIYYEDLNCTVTPSIFIKEYACILSHVKALQYYKDNYNKIGELCIIAEDDLSFNYVKYWKKKIIEYINNLPEDWEIFKMFINNLEHNIKNTEIFNHKELKTYGAVIYLVNINSCNKILEYYKDIMYKDNINITLDMLSDRKMYDICTTYVQPLFTFRDNNDTNLNTCLDQTLNFKKYMDKIWENESTYF